MPPEKSPLKQIRTFQGDVAEALHTQNESLVSIQRAQHAKNPAVETAEDKPTGIKKSLLLILGSFVLVLGGALGAWYSYNEYKVRTAVPAPSLPDNRFLSSTGTNIDTSGLDRTGLVSKIQESLDSEVGSGELRQLELRVGSGESSPLLDTTKFLTILETGAPGNLVRALDPLFMLGEIGGETKSTFIIYKVSSFENAYAGMLDWEKSLKRDLGPIFATRESLQNISDDSLFQDISVKNKDARAIRDSDGKTVLLYSFFDNKWLIITDNEASLESIIANLTSQKLSR